MPRLTKSLPKYRKHRASGQAIVTIAGKDHYLGPYGTKASKALYDRYISEFLSCGRGASDDETAEVTVVEILAAYWRFAQTYYVKDGVQTNELDAMRVIIRDAKRLYGNLPASQFGPKALKAVRQEWINRGQVRTAINKNMRRLTRVFRWAVAEELLSPAVHQALAAVSGLKKGRCEVPEAPPILPVDVAVVEQTLPFLLPVTRDMVRLQLLSGMRPGEVCTLRPADIDRDGEVWEYYVGGHKTVHHGRIRTVYIGPLAQALSRPYVLREASMFCFSPSEATEHARKIRESKRKTPLSCGNRAGTNRKRRPRKASGLRYTPDSYRRAIHYACDFAFPPSGSLAKRPTETIAKHRARLTAQQLEELKAWRQKHRWNPNQLRHTKATEVRKLFGLEAAQVILGHAAADVTQVYAERDAEKARDVARRVG